VSTSPLKARRRQGTPLPKDSRPPFDERFPDGAPRNGCARCCRDFASLTAFDQHFDRFDDRVACGGLDEGWLQDRRGRWTTVMLAAQAEGMAERFSTASLRRNERAGRVRSAQTTKDLSPRILSA
jgi:hypothetical protein